MTGGKGGIMEYAARGAKENGGITIGVITGPRRTSNKWTDVEIVTGSKISGFDEVFIPLMCDTVIVIGGGVGTLQEICVSYRNKIPIIVLEKTFGWVKKILEQEDGINLCGLCLKNIKLQKDDGGRNSAGNY